MATAVNTANAASATANQASSDAQDAIDDAQAAITTAQGYAANAEGSAQAAAASATAAQTAQTNAQTAQLAAEAAEQAAEDAARQAQIAINITPDEETIHHASDAVGTISAITYTLEEIAAMTDPSGKIPDASAVASLRESLSTNDYFKTEGFTENTSFGSVAGLRIRVGKTVYLSFEVTLTASLPSTTILFTVPNGFKPALNTNSLLVLYKPSSADITFYTRVAPIDTDGNIKQNVSGNAPSGARIIAYYAYKTNDAEPS